MVNYMDDKIGLMVTALKKSTTKAPDGLFDNTIIFFSAVRVYRVCTRYCQCVPLTQDRRTTVDLYMAMYVFLVFGLVVVLIHVH